MAAGYEARARVTADVSGFVAGARSVAAAANTATAALRAMSTVLAANQRAANQAATNLQSFAQAASSVSRSQQQNAQAASQAAQSASQMAQAYNQGAAAAARSAQAQNSNAQAQRGNIQSLQAMGRELNRLRNEQERYQAILAQGQRLNRDQAESYARVQARISELTRDYIRLSSAERETVTASRELAQANRLATQGLQEHAAANTRLAQTGRLTHTQLQQLGREIQRVSQQYTQLTQATQARGSATQAEVTAMRTLRASLGELIATYRQLDQAQRGVVNQTRATVGATQSAAAAQRDLAAGARESATSMRGLDNSLWSVRSALGDLQGFLTQITSSFRRAASELATTFSEQEMAIAHISRVTQATMSEMDILTNGIRELARVIPLPFEELGMIARLGAQVGIAKDSIVDFTETVALFAATTDVTAEAASTMFARIQQMTDIDDTQFRNLGAAVSELGSNSAATENEILTVVESIATMASQAGMSGEAIIGLGSAMASLRIRPEIARGATQRVFLQLTSAVEDAGSEMERMVELTGRTEAELQNLAATDFDQFFMVLMEGLHGASEAGQSLVPILRQLGILNSRDAEVVARLAANYDVLSNSIDLAAESFAAGTYLQREADRIFQTLTAQVQLMSNAWDELKFSMVAAIGPLVEVLVSGATAVIRFISESELLVAVLGRLLIVGAVAAAFAGLVAIVSGVVQAWIALRAALASGVVAMGLMSSSAAASASTMGLLAGAARGATTALAASAASAGVAATAMRALSVAMRLIAPLAIVTAIMAAVSGLQRLTQSAQEANRAHLDAAGGVETLKQAMIDDTQAAMDSNDALIFRRQALAEMSAEELEAAGAARELAGNQRGLAAELGTTASAMSEMGDAAQAGTGAYNELGVEAANAGVAIGEANRAFAASAVESVVSESGVLRSRDAFNMLRTELEQFGGLGGLVEMELRDAGSASEALSETWWELSESLGFFERLGADASSLLNSLTGGFVDLRGDTALALDALLDLESGFEGITEAQIEAINSLELFQGELSIAEDGTVEFTGGLDELSEGMEGMEDAASASAEAFADFAQGVSTAFGSIAELGQGLEEEEQNLSNYTQQLEDMMEARVNFTANLLALQGRVSDESLAAMASNAEQFAPILEELANSGDDVVTNFDEMLSFVEGELQERYAAAMEELTTISADSAQGIVSEQLDELNRLWEEGKIGPREYVEELEALLDTTTTGFSGVAEEQVNALAHMFDGGLLSAEQFATALRRRFEEAGDLTSTMLAGQIELLQQHLADGEISVSEFVDAVVALLEESDYTIEPELDPEQAMRDAGELSDNIRTVADDTDATFVPAVDPIEAEGEITTLRGFIESNADESDPVFEPSTDGSEARSDMRSTRSAIEKTASDSKPTVKVRADGSGARSDMTGIMSSLRSLATTIWVNVRGQSQGIGKGWGGRKDGGWVSGPGGTREDKIPMWLSSREFVVNARSAREFGPLLEWINSQTGGRNNQMPVAGSDSILTSPNSPLRNRTMTPASVEGAQRTRMPMTTPPVAINVYNTYPQAEPTSTTINRSLQYAALMGGTTS